MKIIIPIKTHQRLLAIEYRLAHKACEPEQCCWLVDENGEDSDENYCFDCIQTLVANPKHGENFARAGYAFENDNPTRCKKCGKVLEYTLTDYGVEQELDYYVEYPPENLDDANKCFELHQLAGGLYTIEQKAKFLKVFRGMALP